MAAFVTVITALLIAFPGILLNPGPLMKGHQALENNCFSCHRPFAGASQQCAECHKPADIGIKNAAGRLLPVKNNKALFHRALSVTSCVRCHSDHKGRQPKYTVNTFMHDSLSVALKNNCMVCHADRKPADTLHRSVNDACAACHSTDKWKNAVFDHTLLAASGRACSACHRKDAPSDALHRQVTSGCSSCHRTTRWKPATFDHNRSLSAALKNNCIACHAKKKPGDSLHQIAGNACASCHRTDWWSNAVFDHTRIAASGRECTVCHKKDVPSDALHRQITSGCSSCHKTARWKPATFDHSRYFRLDRDHQASCATCHDKPGNYKAYTCMNCHEHSPSRIAREHLEEGIRNYNNCIKCHRSASEHAEGGERRHGGWGDDD